MAVIRSISVGMFLTFHRAFDVCTNPRQSFETIIKLGIAFDFFTLSSYLL